MTITRTLAASAAMLLTGTAVLAADLPALPVPAVVAPAVVADAALGTLAGYIELRAGFVVGHQPFADPGGAIDWRNVLVGGADRVAVAILPALALQFDAWADYLIDITPEPDVGPSSIGTEAGPDWHGGTGVHLVVGAERGFRFAALGSFGLNTDANENTRGPADGLFVNVGGEMSRSFGNFRVTGQGGFTLGVRGNTALSHDRDIYGDLGVAFYPTPNLGLSAHVGWDRFGSDFYLNQTLSYGVRIEARLGASPFTVFAAYEGSRMHGAWVTDYPETWVANENTFVVGLRLLLGRSTLQALDTAVPFADRNPVYGDPFAVH